MGWAYGMRGLGCWGWMGRAAWGTLLWKDLAGTHGTGDQQ